MIKFRQKEYTRWDETDRLKQMRDSDILAEEKKKNPSRLSGALKGGAGGAILGGTLGVISGMKSGKILSGLQKGAGIGAGIGALGGAAFIGNKKRSENNFYNDRLEYAQRNALRREKKDWKQNMTQREGYTY